MKNLFYFLLYISLPVYVFAQPVNYYQSCFGLSGEELRSELYNLIKDHTSFSYTTTKTILRESDEDNNNPSNIILVYSGNSIDKFDFASNLEQDFWNREHVWPKSHGFPDEDDNAYTDVHNLKPSDRSVNSSRGTKDYDFGGSQHSEATECLTDSDSWEPSDSVKGDIARILFYMVVRYDPGYDHNNNSFDLELVDYTTPNNNDPILGKLSSLIQWHYDDPVDDFEITRNEIIYEFQENRNPFIDHPNLVSFIWGENIGENWDESLGLDNILDENLILFPNPSAGILNFNKYLNNERIEIFSLKGYKVFDQLVFNSNSITLNLDSGVYVLKISNNSSVTKHKIIIK